MSTALFDSVIFGPIHSRRLGVSLGVNLIRPDSKLCNFDCIYCECGWNKDGRQGAGFNSVEDVLGGLERWIVGNPDVGLDYITFAGNGEPTMHPDFAEIIGGVIAIRDRLAPRARIAVLSNATMIDRAGVVEALMRVERPILKFDSAVEQTYMVVNQPQGGGRSVWEVVELLKSLHGRFIMQTMFLRGGEVSADGVFEIDNTTPEELQAWMEVVRSTHPREVMIYSLDRDTPQAGLEKVTTDELIEIAQRVERELGVPTNVPGR